MNNRREAEQDLATKNDCSIFPSGRLAALAHTALISEDWSFHLQLKARIWPYEPCIEANCVALVEIKK